MWPLPLPSTWLIGFVAAAVLALAGWFSWSTIRTQREEIGQLRQQVVQVSEIAVAAHVLAAQKDADLVKLTGKLKSLEISRVRLQNMVNDRAGAMARMEAENAEYKEWANRPLPDAACRLLNNGFEDTRAGSNPVSGCWGAGNPGAAPVTAETRKEPPPD